MVKAHYTSRANPNPGHAFLGPAQVTGIPEYDPAKLPVGWVACPHCNAPVRTLTDGHTVRTHAYQGAPRCPGSGQVITDLPNGEYVPDKVFASPRGVLCMACGAKPGEKCTNDEGAPIPYFHAPRRALHLAMGEAVVLVEGTQDAPHPSELRRKAKGRPKVDYTAVPCADCNVGVGTKCTTKSTHIGRKRLAIRKYNADVHGIT